jgi:hypothetical protein
MVKLDLITNVSAKIKWLILHDVEWAIAKTIEDQLIESYISTFYSQGLLRPDTQLLNWSYLRSDQSGLIPSLLKIV